MLTGIISLSHVLTSLLAAELVSYKCLKLGPITFSANGVFGVNECLLGLKMALNAVFAMHIVVLPYFLSMTLPAVFEIYSPFDTTFSPPTKT